MTLCFIEPQNAIQVIADSVGAKHAARSSVRWYARGWTEIPEPELEAHYAKAVADLDEHDLSLLAAWHVSLEVGLAAAEPGVPRQRIPVAGGEPARGAEDRGRVPRRGGLRRRCR